MSLDIDVWPAVDDAPAIAAPARTAQPATTAPPASTAPSTTAPTGTTVRTMPASATSAVKRRPEDGSAGSRKKVSRNAARDIFGGVALTLFILTAWALVYVLVISNVQEARSQHELYAHFRAEVAQPFGSDPAPIGPPIKVGAPVAVLNIPDAGVRDVVVVEGTASGTLRAGPGHLPSSPLPGEPGFSQIFGRAATFGSPFAHLSALHAGDSMNVTTAQGKFTYKVIDVRHPGDPVAAPPANQGGRLILVTSEASGWRSGWAPSGVVYVAADLQGKTVTDPGGRPATSADEQPMAREGGAVLMMQLVLLLQLLLIVCVVLVWTRQRWSRWQLWLVALPVVLVTLWGLTTTATRLLPNLL